MLLKEDDTTGDGLSMFKFSPSTRFLDISRTTDTSYGSIWVKVQARGGPSEAKDPLGLPIAQGHEVLNFPVNEKG